MAFKGNSTRHILEEGEESKRRFIEKALAGKARWGAWRYNPNNLTLEFAMEGSDNPYSVNLRRCNTSSQVLDWLCQLNEEAWCSPEQVGYLLQAIDELSGGLQRTLCGGGQIDMEKHLRSMATQPYDQMMTVDEVAELLRVSKLTVYRMIDRGDLEAVKLPIGRRGGYRISKTSLDRIFGRKRRRRGKKTN
jgi:excisionase family DNA binding protein